MAEDVREFFQQFKKGMGQVKEQAPDAINGFAGMFSKIMKDGAITLKTKELIAVAIGVAVQCEPCIRLHVQKCLDAGCTRDEILEAASVAVMMSGGPAYTHMPMVVETLDALQDWAQAKSA
jgi:AhpD family alkylhydroperoxidase